MKKIKFKNPSKKIVNYLRDFSIVVAGIAVTLWGQSWLTERSEKNDTALYMNALKLEMGNNRAVLDSVLIPSMKASMDYIRYISMHDARTVSADSIQRFDGVYNNIRNISFLRSAFETFKSSGTIRFVDNKELLQSIWQSHTHLSAFEAWIKQYYDDKWAEIKRERQLEINGRPATIPMYNFYMGNTDSFDDSVESNIVRNAQWFSQNLKELIAEIEAMR